jgi:hypothetical protein
MAINFPFKLNRGSNENPLDLKTLKEEVSNLQKFNSVFPTPHMLAAP